MRKEYEDIVRNVCRLSNWKAATIGEKQGAIGVACVLAYLRGVKAATADLANHIGVPQSDVEIPFKRLQVNGVFSSKLDVQNDPMFSEDPEVFRNSIKDKPSPWGTFTAEDQAQNAWCVLAGIAGGLTGLRETPPQAVAA